MGLNKFKSPPPVSQCEANLNTIVGYLWGNTLRISLALLLKRVDRKNGAVDTFDDLTVLLGGG